jgi:hypothetical protein
VGSNPAVPTKFTLMFNDLKASLKAGFFVFKIQVQNKPAFGIYWEDSLLFLSRIIHNDFHLFLGG